MIFVKNTNRTVSHLHFSELFCAGDGTQSEDEPKGEAIGGVDGFEDDLEDQAMIPNEHEACDQLELAGEGTQPEDEPEAIEGLDGWDDEWVDQAMAEDEQEAVAAVRTG